MLCAGATASGALAGGGRISSDDALQVVQQLRQGGCDARRSLSPLRRDAALQVVAQRLAAGANLKSALQRADYLATQITVLHATGVADAGQLRETMTRQHCTILLNNSWQDWATAARGDAHWIVLAVPQVIPEDAATIAQNVLQLVNRARSQSRRCGSQRFAPAGPLTLSDALTTAARTHAIDMARHDSLEHTGSDGSVPLRRVSEQGYSHQLVGENIAAGPGTADEVVNGWLASPGHCANLMNGRFQEMGLAFAINRRTRLVVFWTQVFAQRAASNQ